MHKSLTREEMLPKLLFQKLVLISGYGPGQLWLFLILFSKQH